MIRRILIVCVGNVCRSPMAAAMLQAACSHTSVRSAGVNALIGEQAHPIAVRLMRERGLDLSAHRARQLDDTLAFDNDLLLVMDRPQKAWIEARWQQARGRVYRWGHWSDFDVPDPYRGDEHAFRETLVLLDRGLEQWRPRL